MFLMSFFTSFPRVSQKKNMLFLPFHLSQDHGLPEGRPGFNLVSIYIGAGEFQYIFTISKAKINSYICPALISDETDKLSSSPPSEQKSSED